MHIDTNRAYRLKFAEIIYTVHSTILSSRLDSSLIWQVLKTLLKLDYKTFSSKLINKVK